MSIKYNLSKEDYIQYLLFFGSNSKDVQAKKNRNWSLISAALIICSVYFIWIELYMIALVALILLIIALLIYPKYYNWTLRNKYIKLAEENSTENLSVNMELKVEQGLLKINNYKIERILNSNEMKEIYSTQGHLFIQTNTKESFIVPKQNKTNVRELDNLLLENGFEINDYINWKFNSF